MFDENVSTIRFWEKNFDILKPKKNRKGNRRFTPEDVENLRIIHHLLRERGFTIKGAIEKMNSNKEDTINQVEIVKSLKKVKAFLLEIKEQL